MIVAVCTRGESGGFFGEDATSACFDKIAGSVLPLDYSSLIRL